MTFQRASLPLTATFSPLDCFFDISLPVAIVCHRSVVSIGIETPSGTRQYSRTFLGSTRRIAGPKMLHLDADRGSRRCGKCGLDPRMQTEPATYLGALADSHGCQRIGLGKLHRDFLLPESRRSHLRPQAATVPPQPQGEGLLKTSLTVQGLEVWTASPGLEDGFSRDSLETQRLWRSAS
jgi:hypothetical protein